MSSQSRGPDSSASRFAAVTPTDAAAFLAYPCRALYVGSTGDIAVDDEAGNAVTFAGVPAGTVLPVRTKRVRSTGTTASAIVALF